MRITTGSAKGIILKTPQGVRPTKEAVKLGIFSILSDLIVNAKVADIFAGSGALGMEALSRGAKSCLFVEDHKSACKIIKENLKKAKLVNSAAVICGPVEILLKRQKIGEGESFDLVFCDPPYAYEAPAKLLNKITAIVKKGGILVFEHAKNRQIPTVSPFKLAKWGIWGETKVSFFVKL